MGRAEWDICVYFEGRSAHHTVLIDRLSCRVYYEGREFQIRSR
jgi:hypothetical protein